MLIISFVYFDALSFLVFLFFLVLLNHYSQNHMGYLIIVGKYMRRKFYQSKFYVIIFVFFFCFQLNLIYRRFVYLFCSRERDRNRKPLIIYRFKLLFLSVFVCLFLSLFVCSWSECFVKYRTQQQQKKNQNWKTYLKLKGEKEEGVKMHRINFLGIYNNNNTLFANRQSGYSTTTTTKVRLWCKVFLFISISTSMNSKEPKKNWIRFEYWYICECIEHTYCVILITF